VVQHNRENEVPDADVRCGSGVFAEHVRLQGPAGRASLPHRRLASEGRLCGPNMWGVELGWQCKCSAHGTATEGRLCGPRLLCSGTVTDSRRCGPILLCRTL